MKRCPRSFDVEAMRDGRLAGPELASFARHLAACPSCLREARALDGLAEQLRATGGDADELHVLRERVRLLAAFDRELLARDLPVRGLRRLRWPGAALALAAACLVIWWRLHPVRPAIAVVSPNGDAVWSQHTEGLRREIVLVRGALSIHVDHGSGRGRLVVRLPDGELEDQGTTFTVTVADGQTTRVAVDEGSVRLAIGGRAPVVVGAGETWTREPPRHAADAPRATGAAALASPSAAVPAPPAAVSVAAVGARPARGPTAASRTAGPRPSPARRAAVVATPALPDPAVDFGAAVAVLDVGAHREAAAAFATFLARYPQDPRAEDAAYLRVIALERCGAQGDMKRAAHEYLRLYPAGFRRAEVERLSR
jgi:TolA-binding protein